MGKEIIVYAISRTPEGGIASSGGYEFMAGSWVYNEAKMRLMHLHSTEFFKTQEEADEYQKEHPEYKPIAIAYHEKVVDKKVSEAVEYMISIGTEKTLSGNYHFDFDEIEQKFRVKVDDYFKSKVVVEAMHTGKLLDIDIEEDFDFMFGLAYCPNAEEDEEQ